mmetsp:Transcript_995/g.2097  ORF Transcript_995/g.2097 Transcript_995/m.2097 type:complete len:133 (-) Transcript_995:79-477(-)
MPPLRTILLRSGLVHLHLKSSARVGCHKVSPSITTPTHILLTQGHNHPPASSQTWRPINSREKEKTSLLPPSEGGTMLFYVIYNGFALCCSILVILYMYAITSTGKSQRRDSFIVSVVLLFDLVTFGKKVKV